MCLLNNLIHFLFWKLLYKEIYALFAIGKDRTEMPIIVDGEQTKIRITELEKIFGLERNYTAAFDEKGYALKESRRRRVLGKCLCGKTLVIKLNQLPFYFLTKSAIRCDK